METLLEGFPHLFVGLFNDDPALAQTAIRSLRVAFLLGVQFSCQQTFVAFGQAKISIFLAMLRKIILLIPLIYIFPHFFANKVFAVFLAEPVADILASLTTGTVFLLRAPKIIAARARSMAEQRHR